MNIKKLLIIGLILMAVSMGFSAINAEEISTSQTKLLVDNVLTLNDIQFKIPDGYSEVETDTDNSNDDFENDFDNDDIDDNDLSSDLNNDPEDIDGTPVDAATTCEFKNGANDKIEIQVGIKGNNQKIESINPAGYEQKTIAGKEGYLKKETDDGKDQYKFEYLQDGKIVKIVASSEDIINNIIA